MIKCINCGLNVSRMKRYLIQCDFIRGRILQQNSLDEIPNDSVVCQSCWSLFSESPETYGNERQQVGHGSVCAYCGRSTFRSRAHTLNDGSELEQRIKCIVKEKILPRQLRPTDEICHPCWQKCSRLAKHYTQPSTSSAIYEREVSLQFEDPPVQEPPAEEFHTPEASAVLTADELPTQDPPAQEAPVPDPPAQEPPIIDTPAQEPPRFVLADVPRNLDLPVPELAAQGPPAPAIPARESTIYLERYSRAADSQRHCFFPNCHHAERLSVPFSLRARLFADYNFFVPENCRICQFHLRANLWHQLTEVDGLNHMFSESHIYDFTNLLRHEPVLDFENIDMMADHLVHYWFGRTKDEFRALLTGLPRLSQMRKGSTALAAYLLKLRNGDSNARIASLFQMPRSTLEHLMSKARDILLQDFVPRHLGIGHMTRDEVAERNLIIPNGLFGLTEVEGERKPIVIVDGTYIYCQKSSNYKYQKETYPLHKYRNLVKPCLFVCTDGYILEVLGPYPATTSDAEIMSKEFADEEMPLRQYFQQGDVFILDRGFRDSIPLLENCNYSLHSPSSLEDDEWQLSTLETNKSRAVTICRWVVEVVNGIFKQEFKIFRQEFYNRASPHLMMDFSIAAALINRFHARIRDREDAAQILEIINEKMFQSNTLADFIIRNNVNRRRAQFVNIDVNNQNVQEFPELTIPELILIACGTYQIKQARSYYGEHIRANGEFSIEICREDYLNDIREELALDENVWLLRGKIQSRHVGRKIYYVYIMIDGTLNGRNAIKQYYCNGLVGRRTVGCCAHTMSILWYLGWARYQNNISAPAEFLDGILISYDDIFDDDGE